jgi:hypothetical protein
MITFRFTVDQFERLLTVMLAEPTPDYLTNLVLMACTRVRDGIISVPVPPADAATIAALVDAAAQTHEHVAVIAALMRTQMESRDRP